MYDISIKHQDNCCFVMVYLCYRTSWILISWGRWIFALNSNLLSSRRSLKKRWPTKRKIFPGLLPYILLLFITSTMTILLLMLYILLLLLLVWILLLLNSPLWILIEVHSLVKLVLHLLSLLYCYFVYSNYDFAGSSAFSTTININIKHT